MKKIYERSLSLHISWIKKSDIKQSLSESPDIPGNSLKIGLELVDFEDIFKDIRPYHMVILFSSGATSPYGMRKCLVDSLTKISKKNTFILEHPVSRFISLATFSWWMTPVSPAARQTERAAELPSPAPSGISLSTVISMGTTPTSSIITL